MLAWNIGWLWNLFANEASRRHKPRAKEDPPDAPRCCYSTDASVFPNSPFVISLWKGKLSTSYVLPFIFSLYQFSHLLLSFYFYLSSRKQIFTGPQRPKNTRDTNTTKTAKGSLWYQKKKTAKGAELYFMSFTYISFMMMMMSDTYSNR